MRLFISVNRGEVFVYLSAIFTFGILDVIAMSRNEIIDQICNQRHIIEMNVVDVVEEQCVGVGQF